MSYLKGKEVAGAVGGEAPEVIIALNPDGIPKELKSRPNWVCWRAEERDGKPTKVPYNPRTGRRASTIDSTSWASFEETFEAYQGGKEYQGVGFVFSSGDPYTGVDLDGCRDPETGEVEPWAQAWVERFTKGYVEVSPTGTGLHIIVRGKTPHNGKRTKGGKTVEVYRVERFFTVTGQEVLG